MKEPSPPRGNAAEPTGCESERGAENPARGDGGAKELGFEKFCNEIRNGHGAPAEQIEDAGLSEVADAAARFQEIPEIFGRGMIDRRRRDGTELREEGGGIRERRGELSVFRGVFCGEAGDTSGGLGRVVVEKERSAIRRRCEDAGIGLNHFIVKLFELQIFRHVGAQWAESVSERGGAEAGIKFLGDGASAHHFAALEDERLERALGQIKSGDESVVSAADENYALSERHGQWAALDAVSVEREDPPFHSFKMTWLAMRPFAPMMPPPGCVAEPHI